MICMTRISNYNTSPETSWLRIECSSHEMIYWENHNVVKPAKIWLQCHETRQLKSTMRLMSMTGQITQGLDWFLTFNASCDSSYSLSKAQQVKLFWIGNNEGGSNSDLRAHKNTVNKSCPLLLILTPWTTTLYLDSKYYCTPLSLYWKSFTVKPITVRHHIYSQHFRKCRNTDNVNTKSISCDKTFYSSYL